jgi:hypothetical protein
MTEDEICKELMIWARLNMKRYSCLELFHHIDNEGKRAPWKAKDKGILAGLPDYHLPEPIGGYKGFWLEIKGTDKKPTQKQRDRMVQLRDHGHWADWTDKLQAAINWLHWYVQGAR